MEKLPDRTPIKGGWIKRDTASGHLVEVGSGESVTKASPKSQSSVRGASSKRSSALKRLANR